MMKRYRLHRTLSLIVAFFMAFHATSAAAQPASDEQQLRDIQQGLAQAWLQKDRAFNRDGAWAGVERRASGRKPPDACHGARAIFEGVGLELPILALIPGSGNVAWRPASDLR